MMKKFYEQLINERKSYSEMIQFCCDGLILNNDIISVLESNGLYFESYTGNLYDEETDEYIEVYQNYIIDGLSAERLSRYTNEIVLYNDDIDIYILCVTHWGMPWSGVVANWKTIEEMENN